MKVLRALSLLAVITATAFAVPSIALACGSCYGAADSPQKSGMNFAILSMIGVTGGVLASMMSFFLYLRRRARAYLLVQSEEHGQPEIGGKQ